MYAGAVRDGFSGECWTQSEPAAKKYGLRHQAGIDAPGLGEDVLHFGSHSGYQAINLAYIFGATRILLLGYDCRVIDGKRHYFGNHPGALNKNSSYELFAKSYRSIDTKLCGLEIVNCTPGSMIDVFPRADIAHAV